MKKPRRTRHVFVACFPKSGSTYLCRFLTQLTGLRKKTIQRAGPGSTYWEQDICPLKLRKLHLVPNVVHQHVKGIPPNIHLLRTHGVLPIVLTRHIGDVIMSVHDHIANESAVGPITYVPRNYPTMSYEQRLNFLINTTVPWFLSFYISWKEASERTTVLWTSYEQLFADTTEQVSRIADFCGFTATPAEIDRTISTMERKHTRKNVGVSGRGHQLSDEHKRLINQHALSWALSDKDLRKLGLPLPVGTPG